MGQEDALRELKSLRAADLFPAARSPECALAGLFLYAGGFREAHSIAQEIHTPEGSYWHGILHREEPDPFNAAYWFRKAGRHSIFPALREEALRIGYPAATEWDPSAFIEFREAGQKIYARVAQAEWRLLMAYCGAKVKVS